MFFFKIKQFQKTQKWAAFHKISLVWLAKDLQSPGPLPIAVKEMTYSAQRSLQEKGRQ